ncbi:aspartyl protease family protein [Leptobacterium sp. I13]|uniref:aspartyl protease family protein n=1 Tax=Leptobacterium meishanense TaxID=3128904 RepID=UPI0030ED35DE
MLKLYLKCFFVLFVVCSFYTYSQSTFKLPKGQKKEKVRFKLVSNLIIIPVEVNGIELSFILDTGVNKPILFNLSDNDSLEVKNIEEIYIRGLGEGEAVKALHSKGNFFKIGDIYNNYQDLYMVLDQEINLSPRLGIPVHGIIGFDLIKDFVLDINYMTKTVKFHNRLYYEPKKCRKCEEFPIELIQNKAYVDAYVSSEEALKIPVRLLLDSGNSDALWLFPNEEKNIKIPEKSFRDYIGRGLSGNIYGSRARVKSFQLGNFSLKEAKVAFPDSISISPIKNIKERDGSLGGDVLKRFHVTLDYQSRKIRLRKNSKFKERFKYNMSGIEVQHNGIRYVKEREANVFGVVERNNDASGNVQILLTDLFKILLPPAIEIAEIREGSPAAEVGLKKGDILITINGKQTYKHSLQEVIEMLNEKEGRRIRLVIEREGRELSFLFELKRVL